MNVAAILGSVLANLLLCLGMCFFVGGTRHKKQEFAGEISEVGSGLLLVAGFGLSIPCAFTFAINAHVPVQELQALTLKISRSTAIILLVAYLVYVFFQVRTHHSIISDILERDEERDRDREDDLKKRKLTLTECAIALVIALTFVSLHAIFLVEEIEPIIVESNISDMFMGLILVPLVGKCLRRLAYALVCSSKANACLLLEKIAEHLTAIGQSSLAFLPLFFHIRSNSFSRRGLG